MTGDGAGRAAAPLDPFQMWRQFYEINEQAWTRAVKEMVGNWDYAGAQGKMLESFLSVQKMMMEEMGTQWKNLNIPTRDDVYRIGEVVVGVEGKVAQLEPRLAGLGQELAGVEGELAQLDYRLAAMEERLLGLEKRQETGIEEVDRRLQELDRRLVSLPQGGEAVEEKGEGSEGPSTPPARPRPASRRATPPEKPQ